MSKLLSPYCRKPTTHELALFVSLIKNPATDCVWHVIEFDALSIIRHAFRFSSIWGVLIVEPTQKIDLDIVQKLQDYGIDSSNFDNIAPQGIIPSIPIDFNAWSKSLINAILSAIVFNNDLKLIIVCKHKLWADHIKSVYKALNVAPHPDTITKTISQLIEKTKTVSSQCQYEAGITNITYFLKIMSQKEECFYEDSFEYTMPDSLINVDQIEPVSFKLSIRPYLKDSAYSDILIFKRINNEGDTLLLSYKILPKSFPTHFTITFHPWTEIPFCEFEKSTKVEPLSLSEQNKSIPNIEILVLVDATMGAKCLQDSFEQLSKIFLKIERQYPDTRFGLAAFGDQDLPNMQSQYLLDDITKKCVSQKEWYQKAMQFNSFQPLDFMTALAEGLELANNYNWNEETHQFLIVIGFRPPHPFHWPDRPPYSGTREYKSDLNWEEILSQLINKEIRLISIYLPDEELKSTKNINVSHILAEGETVWKAIGKDLYIDNINEFERIDEFVLGQKLVQDKPKYIYPMISYET